MVKLLNATSGVAGGLAAGLVIAIALVGSSAAGAGVQEITCGSTLTTDTTLVSDLDCSSGPTPALTLASGVTLDLGGHTVSGSGPRDGFGINGQSYTVRNGTITGFGHAIETLTSFTGAVTLSHVRLLANGQGVEAFWTRVNISDSVINRNGVGLGGTTPSFVVNDTTINDNGAGAVFYQGGFTGSRVSISNNEGDGIRINQGVISLIDSKVNGNGGFGVDVVNSYQAPLATFSGNTASRNGADGIRLAQGDPLSFPNQWYFSHNTANFNHNYGIEIFNFDGGITGYDKGGNVARGNGQPAQCLNITCSSN